ncbi:ABC transporter ATP-binding protein [Hymenobacter glacieicola]|uniref:ABC transporter ATP-binding protein n=1 Tax=Hymenobacter glacieicola TaxID=1562124 RepID=A0ABQ1X0C1_9BACT|nr:ABC transporter ATP-binding protein [Hymenobacter glacieicola]GGG53454.1 ABC transporter ATP-binding protein [Hymenobacter glacieicola]
MLLLLLLASILDVFGLASLVPVIMAASRPGSVLQNKYSLWLYQALGFSTEKSFLVFLIVAVFFLFLFKNLFSTLISYQQVKFTARIALTVIASQFQKHINLPYLRFNEVGSPNLMNSTLNVPNAFVNGIIRQLFIFFSELIIVALVITGMLIYQPILFVILGVVLVPSMMLIYRLLRNRSQRVGVAISELRPFSYGALVESFIGFVELRLAGKQRKFKQRLLDNQEEIQDLEADAYLYSLIPQRLIEMVAIAAVVTIFLYSLLFADNPASLITIIGLFAAAAYRLMPSMNRLLTALVTLKQNQYVIDDLFSMREYLQIPEPVQQPLEFEKSISFDHVSFTFPGSEKPVLDNISFTVNKGEKIGFIGSSGSGKTTLMNLLLRFYAEGKGSIKVDGTALSPANLAAWYQLVGYVKQDTFLMEASIGENITLRDEQMDAERMRYALEQASLTDFVAKLPEGLNTSIGERGSRLSGGQRQRIGIARALYKQAEVLVLDEATSALDNETEREVSEAISKLSHTNITLFIIAHRLTTLRECDRIYELRDGQIVAEHQYENLMRTLS